MNKTTLAGAIGAGGLVIQIILGFALSGSGNPTGDALIYPHVLIGVAGLALVAFLVYSIFRTPSSMNARLVYTVALLLTLVQVVLGYALLGSASQGTLMAHQGIAILLLLLLAAGGMFSAKSRRMAKAQASAAPPV